MSDADRYDEEVRLALVLNGGVSLAIWMGGVTCELDRARRAGFSALPQDSDSVWVKVCKALGTRVTIDVVAGTSAGGLNGAVLAAAVARRAAMPNLREKWKQLGDFDELLIRKDESDELSVLNGGFFADSIREVFEELRKTPVPEIDEELAPSTVALTLTSTALHGDVNTYQDQARVPFMQREYRVLYRFRRGSDPTPGHPGAEKLVDTFEVGAELLPQVARATASFPGAFAPVQPAPPPLPEMRSLRTPDWLMDGGVLDNEPFAPVLEEIRMRPVERGTRRVLAYVVPSTGDDVDDPKARDVHKKPGFLTPLWLATSLPRETNIVEQLDAVRGMLARVAVDRGTTERLLAGAAGSGNVANMAGDLLPLYQERRYLGGMWHIRERLAAAPTALISLRPAPPWTATGKVQAPWVPTTLDPPTSASGGWGFGLSVAEDVVHTWLDAVRDVLLTTPELAKTAASISRSHRLLVAMDEEFEAAIRDSAEGPEAGDDAIRRLGEEAFAAAAGTDAVDITAEVWAAAEAMVGAKGHLGADVRKKLALDDGEVEAIRRQLIVAVVQGTFTPPTLDPPVPRFTFRRVGLREMPGLENDRGRVLYGLALNHFGAFLRPSWRLNDWMWGRLDGCAHVAQVLLDETRLRFLAGARPNDLTAALTDALGDEQTVNVAVAGIAAAGDGEATEHVDRLRALLTCRAQLDVLSEELPILRDELSRADSETQDAASGWVQVLGVGATPSDDALKAAFKAYTLGTATAQEVLDEHAGKEGRRDAVLSALRAVRKDPTLPPIVHKLASAAGGVLRVLGAPGQIAGDVGEHIEHAKRWLRDHWPGGEDDK